VHKGEVTTDVLAAHDVVVITDFYNRDLLISWNQFCRSKGIGFIYTGSLGLYGYGFVDFSDKHMVGDKNGEECRNAIVVGISQDAQGLVCVHEDKRHGFEDDDWVTFSEVQGMTEVNA
jgi:ubiquitin-activating enzyme E1